jgi:hypothetical protein
MQWNQVFLKGFDSWVSEYAASQTGYFKKENQLCNALLNCFKTTCKQHNLDSDNIHTEANLLGKTRLDFLLGNEVSLEVKFEPDYPDMPKSLKPVTNTTLKQLDPEVAKTLALEQDEAQFRIGEIELDFLKLLAHKKLGLTDNYLLCLDEDGRLYRNLGKSFKTKIVKQTHIDWKTINRGSDGKTVHYFLWHT